MKGKRILSAVLSAALLLQLSPLAVFAEDTSLLPVTAQTALTEPAPQEPTLEPAGEETALPEEPAPEDILYGMMQLQRKVKVEKFFGGANHKMTQDEKELSMSKGGLRGLSNENLSDSEKLGHKEPIIVTEVPEDFDPQKGLTD